MTSSQSFARSLVFSALAVAIVAGAALAEKFEPRVGQAGKDVVWVPTPQALVDRMLDMAKVMPGDFLMDLGSGDGRTVITAAKRGVRATGVEFNPNMVNLAKDNATRRRRDRACDLRGRRPVRGRHLQGDGDHAVPACPTSICGCARSSST